MTITEGQVALLLANIEQINDAVCASAGAGLHEKDDLIAALAITEQFVMKGRAQHILQAAKSMLATLNEVRLSQ